MRKAGGGNFLRLALSRFELSPFKLNLSKYTYSGFTLAEVLITLGIIGIVAAMTIPTLMTKIQKQKLEAQLKETYSVIQQVMKSAEGDGANFQTAFQDGSNVPMKEWFEEFIQPHLKTETVCYNTPGCWHKKGGAKLLDGTKQPW
ncbi:MAG: type II secretion system GspH family protein, partial [Candidatus Gastranaerophilales bacterium]|nr:type II secretion system GspH family protein [Candidatus Gastranaerophilales bacterium]